MTHPHNRTRHPTLTYDVRNRIQTITGAGPDLTALYDADGIRVKRTLDNTDSFYLGPNYELTDDATGPEVSLHHRLAGRHVATTIDGELMTITDSQLGTITGTVNAAGVLTAQRYTPHGVNLSANTNLLPFDFTFTGQTDDPGTGLIDYNARHYDPELGRFTQADTVLDGLNRYTYVHNNPLKYTDPTGNVRFTSGEKKGRCYQGADGEDEAFTAREEVLTVNVPNRPGTNGDGSERESTNIRFTGDLADVSSSQLIDLWRQSQNNFTDEQDRIDWIRNTATNLDPYEITWRDVWYVGSTIVGVSCIVLTGGACTVAVVTIAATNIAISAHDNEILNETTTCQKLQFSQEVVVNAGSVMVGGASANAVRAGAQSGTGTMAYWMGHVPGNAGMVALGNLPSGLNAC